MRRDTLLALGVVVLVLAALAAKSLLIAVPQGHITPGQFNASRAKARLAFVLGDQRPHPVDPAADDAVRGATGRGASADGAEAHRPRSVRVQRFPEGAPDRLRRVRNVIAILGPTHGKALLLSAHYDSVPLGRALQTTGSASPRCWKWGRS